MDAQTPDDLQAEILDRGVEVDAVISNDVHPNAPLPIEDIPLQALRDSFEALLVFPFRLAQFFLPAMKERRSGQFVFITSARYLQPESAFALATAIREGATGFAMALAKEAAPFGVQVNVMAPNYLCSEA